MSALANNTHSEKNNIERADTGLDNNNTRVDLDNTREEEEEEEGEKKEGEAGGEGGEGEARKHLEAANKLYDSLATQYDPMRVRFWEFQKREAASALLQAAA